MQVCPAQLAPLATEVFWDDMQSAGPCNQAMLVISANQALLHLITSVLVTVSLLAWSALSLHLVLSLVV